VNLTQGEKANGRDADATSLIHVQGSELLLGSPIVRRELSF
jgi:hypothetical protein